MNALFIRALITEKCVECVSFEKCVECARSNHAIKKKKKKKHFTRGNTIWYRACFNLLSVTSIDSLILDTMQ